MYYFWKSNTSKCITFAKVIHPDVLLFGKVIHPDVLLFGKVIHPDVLLFGKVIHVLLSAMYYFI